ncbi:MAG: RDD family protein, partial [Acidobacteriia bacterium]|nr:RDD family protein [Terriglobia bacterium]
MPQQTIAVPPGLTTDGLLGKRYFARFVDSLIIIVLIVVAGALLALLLTPFLRGGYVLSPIRFAIAAVVWIGYEALLESSRWQATVAKRVFGLRVYDSQGGRLGLRQA